MCNTTTTQQQSTTNNNNKQKQRVILKYETIVEYRDVSKTYLTFNRRKRC